MYIKYGLYCKEYYLIFFFQIILKSEELMDSQWSYV